MSTALSLPFPPSPSTTTIIIFFRFRVFGSFRVDLFKPPSQVPHILILFQPLQENKQPNEQNKKSAGHLTYVIQKKSRSENALDHRPDIASIIRVDVERQSDDDVSSQAHAALEVVALAIADEVVDDEDGEEEDDGLEALEVQRHGLADDPAEDDEEGGDEEGDLHAAADRDADGQVHLVLVRDDAGGDVLGGVADNREQDETDEGLADVRGLDDRVDAVDQVFGADCDCEGDEDEADGGCDGAQDLWLLLSAVIALLLLLSVEQVCVGLELEEQVEAV